MGSEFPVILGGTRCRNEYDWFSPLRFTEKGNLEVLLFTIQSKMRANNQKVYMPREGKLISDINKVRLTHVAVFWLSHPAGVQDSARLTPSIPHC